MMKKMAGSSMLLLRPRATVRRPSAKDQDSRTKSWGFALGNGHITGGSSSVRPLRNHPDNWKYLPIQFLG